MEHKRTEVVNRQFVEVMQLPANLFLAHTLPAHLVVTQHLLASVHPRLLVEAWHPLASPQKPAGGWECTFTLPSIKPTLIMTNSFLKGLTIFLELRMFQRLKVHFSALVQMSIHKYSGCI